MADAKTAAHWVIGTGYLEQFCLARERLIKLKLPRETVGSPKAKKKQYFKKGSERGTQLPLGSEECRKCLEAQES